MATSCDAVRLRGSFGCASHLYAMFRSDSCGPLSTALIRCFTTPSKQKTTTKKQQPRLEIHKRYFDFFFSALEFFSFFFSFFGKIDKLRHFTLATSEKHQSQITLFVKQHHHLILFPKNGNTYLNFFEFFLNSFFLLPAASCRHFGSESLMRVGVIPTRKNSACAFNTSRGN